MLCDPSDLHLVQKVMMLFGRCSVRTAEASGRHELTPPVSCCDVGAAQPVLLLSMLPRTKPLRTGLFVYSVLSRWMRSIPRTVLQTVHKPLCQDCSCRKIV